MPQTTMVPSLSSLTANVGRITAATCKEFFLERLARVDSVQEHIHVYNIMLSLMDQMIKIEAYTLGRHLLVRVDTCHFNGDRELRIGLSPDAKNDVREQIQRRLSKLEEDMFC
ncbi:Oidioi.mRNA.OKI2018_I69.PAR.g8532.t1.cds [Oikopleura dioica]|uniref:Oidioi.mRNA.OKI2018_I69.PAR.g8532.t1.cds n=1 Tax=Oikopleura dioica TaxID=34765 RepID=A0ABN7RGF5_OIKDI|nr:Oidioi.mRNA.OKI2018_I69.PAR.g8532.t1.cds [Oikopleura dioica]